MNLFACQVWSKPTNTPCIDSVQVMEGRRLLVTFVNGVTKIYDCTPLLRLDVFRELANDVFFKLVKVDSGGYGISWSDDVDLSEYELWVNGKEELADTPQATAELTN